MPSRTLLLLTLWLLVLPHGLLAQNNDPQARQEARNRYLQENDLLETSQAMESALLAYLNREAVYLPAPQRMQTASFFSFVMILHRMRPADIDRLSEAGLDIAHALTADNRPLKEQALMTDLVVTGTVNDHELLTADDGSEFKDIHIQIKDTYKGIAPAEVITIRQRNGREYGENPAAAAELEIGDTYLLLLSNGMFRYGQMSRSTPAQENVRVSEEKLPTYFSIYRQYKMDGDKVLWSGYNKRQTRRALEEVRWLDELLP